MRMQISIQDQVGHPRAEAGPILLHLLYRVHEFIGPIRFEDPSAHTGLQTVPDHLLGLHVGKHQYFLVRVVSQNVPCRIGAVQVRLDDARAALAVRVAALVVPPEPGTPLTMTVSPGRIAWRETDWVLAIFVAER